MKKDPVKYLVLAVKFQDYVAVNDNLKLLSFFVLITHVCLSGDVTCTLRNSLFYP